MWMMPPSRSRVNQDAAPAYQPDRSNPGQHISISNIYIPLSLTRDVEHRLDLHENTEKNLVTATFEFPGFSKDEVQLNFQNGKLTVSAETNKSEDYVDTGYTIRERLHGKFSRTLQLPQGVQVCRPNIIEYMSIDTHRFTGRTD
jgi:HSP20 family molecular chaperone IbpA